MLATLPTFKWTEVQPWKVRPLIVSPVARITRLFRVPLGRRCPVMTDGTSLGDMVCVSDVLKVDIEEWRVVVLPSALRTTVSSHTIPIFTLSRWRSPREILLQPLPPQIHPFPVVFVERHNRHHQYHDRSLFEPSRICGRYFW